MTASMALPTLARRLRLHRPVPSMPQPISAVERDGPTVTLSPGKTCPPRRMSGHWEGTVDSRVHWGQTWQVPMAWTIGTWQGSACGKPTAPPPDGRAAREW